MIDLWFSSWTDCLATLPMPCDPAPIQASRSGTAFEGAAEQIETWINLQVTVTGLNTRHLDAVESVAVSGQMATATACVSEQATVTTGEGRVIGSGYEATRHQLELEMVDGTWKVVTNDIVATSVVEGEALCVGS